MVSLKTRITSQSFLVQQNTASFPGYSTDYYLDCPGATSLAEWVEDLALESQLGQCILAAAAPLSSPQQFTQALLTTLQQADFQKGLPVAAWISQLQVQLAGTGIKLTALAIRD